MVISHLDASESDAKLPAGPSSGLRPGPALEMTVAAVPSASSGASPDSESSTERIRKLEKYRNTKLCTDVETLSGIGRPL